MPDPVRHWAPVWALGPAPPGPARATGTEYLGMVVVTAVVAAACAVPAAGQVLVLSPRPDLTTVSGLALWMSTGVLLAGRSMGLLLDRRWEGREA